jgi:hypothetical protein
MKSTDKKTIVSFFIIIVTIFSAYRVFAFFSDSEKNALDFSSAEKDITLNDNGIIFKFPTKAKTLEELIKEKKIRLAQHDEILPGIDFKIYPGASILIRRAVKIKILADGKKIEGFALGKNVREALFENNIALSRLDQTVPRPDFPVENNSTITVTRINVEEITKNEDVDFKTTAKNDSKLSWREKKITTPGKYGVREVKYKITYKNGKEISRATLSKKIITEPVTQVETQGTYVKLGKANKGQGTWYAWKGGLFAASRTLPKGSFVKVTNTANGKSVIVEINDYGPEGKGRIIDLDKVAFAKIASIGAGVIGVKVEPVLN